MVDVTLPVFQQVVGLLALAVTISMTTLTAWTKDDFIRDAISLAKTNKSLLNLPSDMPLHLSMLSVSETTPTTFVPAQTEITIITLFIVIFLAILSIPSLVFWRRILGNPKKQTIEKNRKRLHALSLGCFLFGLAWTIVFTVFGIEL